MDNIETQLKKAKRQQNDKINEEIIPVKNRKIGSLPDAPEMNTDEGETKIFESQPSLREVLSSPEGRNRASFISIQNLLVY